MFKRRKIVSKEERVSKQSLETEQVATYDKPKILLVDCDDEVETMLMSEGFNVRSGTFGRPYKSEKGEGYTPVIASFDLPNYKEQEVVVIDLSPQEAAEGPERDKHVPDSENDWWVKRNRGVVNPQPRAMAFVQEAFDRILNSGGVFVVFAHAKDRQDLVFAKISPYTHRLEVTGSVTLDYTNWSFLTILEDLWAGAEHGDEIHVGAKGSSVSQILVDFLGDAVFQCALGLQRGQKQDWSILKFESLAKNKYGQTVSAAISDPRIRGLVLIFPQLSTKGRFLVRLMKEVLPELCSHLFPHITGGKWVHKPEYELPEVLSLNAQKADIAERAASEITALSEQIQQVRSELGWMHLLLTSQDKELVEAVKRALATLGFEKVIDVDEERDQQAQSRREDLQIQDGSPTLIVDVKGVGGLPADADVLQADKHATIRMREWDRTNVVPVSIVNHQRHLPPLERENTTPFRKELFDHSEISHLAMITTWDLFRLVRSFQKNSWEPEDVKPLFYQSGRIGTIPLNYKYLGRVAHVWTHAFSVIIEEEELCAGDRIAFELPLGCEETVVASLQVDDTDVGRAAVGTEVGIRTTPEPPNLKEGVRVFLVRQKRGANAVESTRSE